MISIDWNPPQRRLRQFGVLLVLFAGLVAFWMWRKDHATEVVIAIPSVVTIVAAVGWFVPSVLRGIYVTWMIVALPIGWTISHLVMAIIFYLVLTPIGVIMKLAGRDPMERRFAADATTYWKRRSRNTDPKSYFRQF